MCFPKFPVSHVNVFVGGGKVFSQTGWGRWSDFPLDRPRTPLDDATRLKEAGVLGYTS